MPPLRSGFLGETHRNLFLVLRLTLAAFFGVLRGISSRTFFATLRFKIFSPQPHQNATDLRVWDAQANFFLVARPAARFLLRAPSSRGSKRLADFHKRSRS